MTQYYSELELSKCTTLKMKSRRLLSKEKCANLRNFQPSNIPAIATVSYDLDSRYSMTLQALIIVGTQHTTEQCNRYKTVLL